MFLLAQKQLGVVYTISRISCKSQIIGSFNNNTKYGSVLKPQFWCVYGHSLV